MQVSFLPTAWATLLQGVLFRHPHLNCTSNKSRANYPYLWDEATEDPPKDEDDNPNCPLLTRCLAGYRR